MTLLWSSTWMTLFCAGDLVCLQCLLVIICCLSSNSTWLFSENNISYSFEVWPPPQFLKILVHYQFHYSGHKDGQSELFPENLFRDVRRGLYFLGGGLAIYPLLPSSPTATMEGNIQHTVGGVETSIWKHGRDTDFFFKFYCTCINLALLKSFTVCEPVKLLYVSEPLWNDSWTNLIQPLNTIQLDDIF